MFPVTITLHDAQQLNAVMQALGGTAATPAPAKDTAAKKSTAAATPAAPAPGPTTATKADAPAKTDAVSGPAVGNAAAESQASTAATDAVDFETLKKAFLQLANSAGGRAKCEGVLKPFAVGKLSELKPEQYADALAAISKAG